MFVATAPTWIPHGYWTKTGHLEWNRFLHPFSV